MLPIQYHPNNLKITEAITSMTSRNLILKTGSFPSFRLPVPVRHMIWLKSNPRQHPQSGAYINRAIPLNLFFWHNPVHHMGETTTKDIPPFPDDVPTHSLLIIDYEKLKQGEASEKDTFWKACTSTGFFYLKNHNVDTESMWEMGEATMALPTEVKMNYEQGDSGRSFGYKAAGANNTDEHGNLDTVEFINVSRDDALAWPQVVHRDYPPTVTTRMPSIRKFIEESDAVLRTMLDIMSEYLGLPVTALRERHALEKHSGSESRVIRNPPKRVSGEGVSLGAHSDFGSLSFLHHKIIGGLQVLNTASQEWEYIKPLQGHAICNIGDALSVYSGGILRSSIHRVVPAPGAQGDFVRWSLVYFLRPHTTAIMEPLMGSPFIASSIAQKPIHVEKGVTAGEWFARRIKYQRVANRTGPETWRASRGTENISITSS